MSIGRLFQALGAETKNARTKPVLIAERPPAERREVRGVTSATEVTNSVKYDGARP